MPEWNDTCPKCGSDLRGDPIPEEYIKAGLYREGATHYSRIIIVEYSYDHPEHHDGWSEQRCPDCGYREGRWSGKELKGDEAEPRSAGFQEAQEEKATVKMLRKEQEDWEKS